VLFGIALPCLEWIGNGHDSLHETTCCSRDYHYHSFHERQKSVELERGLSHFVIFFGLTSVRRSKQFCESGENCRVGEILL